MKPMRLDQSAKCHGFRNIGLHDTPSSLDLPFHRTLEDSVSPFLEGVCLMSLLMVLARVEVLHCSTRCLHSRILSRFLSLLIEKLFQPSIQFGEHFSKLSCEYFLAFSKEFHVFFNLLHALLHACSDTN